MRVFQSLLTAVTESESRNNSIRRFISPDSTGCKAFIIVAGRPHFPLNILLITALSGTLSEVVCPVVRML